MAFNINNFIEGTSEYKEHKIYTTEVAAAEEPKETKPKRGRPKKSDVPAKVDTAPPMPTSSMSYIQESIPYTALYQDSNKQLDEAIDALKILSNEVFTDLQSVRASKTLKNKYSIMNDLTLTANNIINTTISAIKEKNSSATQASRFELDRMKSMKSNMNEEDDNTRIANMYDAFVNTPIGIGRTASLGPAMSDMITPANQQFETINMGADSSQMWQQNLDPATNRMLLEAQGSIDTVVMYDAESGNRWFEVLDKSTGQPMEGVEKPDNTYIYDLDINMRGGFAKDSNRGVTYPLVIINGESAPDMSAF